MENEEDDEEEEEEEGAELDCDDFRIEVTSWLKGREVMEAHYTQNS